MRDGTRDARGKKETKGRERETDDVDGWIDGYRRVGQRDK